MNKKLTNRLLYTFIGIIIAAIVLIIGGPFFILDEGTQAVVVRFGRIIGVQTEAGLKFKMPLIDTVAYYPKKILSWDGEPQRLPTQENQFIWVDATARWKISDPAKFYESVSSVAQAYTRLNDVVASAVRTVVAQNPLRESVRESNLINTTQILDQTPAEIDEEALRGIISNQKELEPIVKGRRMLSQEMLEASQKTTPQYGIELIDILTRQIRYSEDLTQSVYARMIKERNQIAQGYRSFGEGKKAEIMGQLERDKKSILSGAYEKSEGIKGIADAQAAQIYSSAYAKDADFFSFWRALESYKRVLPGLDKTLSTDIDYFKHFSKE